MIKFLKYKYFLLIFVISCNGYPKFIYVANDSSEFYYTETENDLKMNNFKSIGKLYKNYPIPVRKMMIVDGAKWYLVEEFNKIMNDGDYKRWIKVSDTIERVEKPTLYGIYFFNINVKKSDRHKGKITKESFNSFIKKIDKAPDKFLANFYTGNDLIYYKNDFHSEKRSTKTFKAGKLNINNKKLTCNFYEKSTVDEDIWVSIPVRGEKINGPINWNQILAVYKFIIFKLF
jgi:hypothetical protein